jgi:hypothetical protein
MIIHILRNGQNPAGIAHNLQLESRMVVRMIEVLVDALHLGVLCARSALRQVSMVDRLSSSEECLVRESLEVVNEYRVSPSSTLFF